MNFTHLTGKRKAISPVLATVILIAITLIAAIAIAGFVFGLFGTFTKTAAVSASVTSCVYNGTNEVCSLSMINSGTSNTNANACSMTFKGTTVTGTLAFVAPSTSLTLTAGQTSYITCTGGGDAGAGNAITGTVTTSNGGSILFSGSSAN